MLNVVFQRVVIDGTLLSLILGAMIMGSLVYNPRLWLQDYPKAVQAKSVFELAREAAPTPHDNPLPAADARLALPVGDTGESC